MAFVALVFLSGLLNVAAVRLIQSSANVGLKKVVLMLDASGHWQNQMESQKDLATVIAQTLSNQGVEVATGMFNSVTTRLLQGFSSDSSHIATPNQNEYVGNAVWMDALNLCRVATSLQFGEYGSSGCPKGWENITKAADCKTAATALGFKWGGVSNEKSAPVGCHEYGDSTLKFNEHPTGEKPASWHRPLCTNGPTDLSMCMLITDNEGMCVKTEAETVSELCKLLGPSWCPPEGATPMEREGELEKCTRQVKHGEAYMKLGMALVMDPALEQIRLQKRSFRDFVKRAAGCSIEGEVRSFYEHGKTGTYIHYEPEKNCSRFWMGASSKDIGQMIPSTFSFAP